jgi:plasmid stabilization system protein ParE
MKIQILPSALEDLADGVVFYERQGAGLGAYFLDTLYSEIDSLALYAGIHRQVFGFHRLLSRRFPYAVYYRTIERGVEVWRVLDCRQDPKMTKRDLKSWRTSRSTAIVSSTES